jgi:hypothetical protein
MLSVALILSCDLHIFYKNELQIVESFWSVCPVVLRIQFLQVVDISDLQKSKGTVSHLVGFWFDVNFSQFVQLRRSLFFVWRSPRNSVLNVVVCYSLCFHEKRWTWLPRAYLNKVMYILYFLLITNKNCILSRHLITNLHIWISFVHYVKIVSIPEYHTLFLLCIHRHRYLHVEMLEFFSQLLIFFFPFDLQFVDLYFILSVKSTSPSHVGTCIKQPGYG